MNYFMAVAVPFFRESDGVVVTESAFAEHLRMLLERLAPRFESLSVAGPEMRREDYERAKHSLGRIDDAADRIRWVPLHATDTSRLHYWTHDALPIARRVLRETRLSGLVHTGVSEDSWRPAEFFAAAAAAWHRTPSIFFVDIDFRETPRMNLETGRWSRLTYLLNRYVYDRSSSLQIRAAVRFCSLVLLKGRALVRDYGKGRPHVRYFLDAAFSQSHVVPQAELEQALTQSHDAPRALEAVYFGRLTAYKGIDRCIRAVAEARALHAADVRLTIIGGGEQRAELEALVHELRLDESVEFTGAVPFGPELFDRLRACDVLLAAPLSEDTPRSALDAMASGLPIVAFDTYYYRELASSGAIELVPWPRVEALAQRLAELSRDAGRIATAARAAREFAIANSQEIWLERRIRWTRELFEASKDT